MFASPHAKMLLDTKEMLSPKICTTSYLLRGLQGTRWTAASVDQDVEKMGLSYGASENAK